MSSVKEINRFWYDISGIMADYNILIVIQTIGKDTDMEFALSLIDKITKITYISDEAKILLCIHNDNCIMPNIFYDFDKIDTEPTLDAILNIDDIPEVILESIESLINYDDPNVFRTSRIISQKLCDKRNMKYYLYKKNGGKIMRTNECNIKKNYNICGCMPKFDNILVLYIYNEDDGENCIKKVLLAQKATLLQKQIMDITGELPKGYMNITEMEEEIRSVERTILCIYDGIRIPTGNHSMSESLKYKFYDISKLDEAFVLSRGNIDDFLGYIDRDMLEKLAIANDNSPMNVDNILNDINIPLEEIPPTVFNMAVYSGEYPETDSVSLH